MQHSLVGKYQNVNPTLPDIQRGQMRQEIVSNEEAHKHEVVNYPLKIVAERYL